MPRTKMEKLLLNPEKFFEKVAKEKKNEVWTYLAYWALLPSIVSMILVGFMGISLGGYIPMPNWLAGMVLADTTLFGAALGVATGITIYIGLFIGLFITSVVAHAVARIFKGRGKFEDTLKVVIYGTSPFYAFGWLPIFGVLFGLYSLILQVPAFKILHRAKYVNAVLMVLGTLFLMGVLVGIIPFLAGVFATGYHPGIVVNTIRGIMALILV